jgi:hypothetical protein
MLGLGASRGRPIAERKEVDAYSTKNLLVPPNPPMSRTNQNRLIGPSIVPDAQFSAAWETQRHNASFIKFADFQIAIFRRELDGQPRHSPT